MVESIIPLYMASRVGYKSHILHVPEPQLHTLHVAEIPYAYPRSRRYSTHSRDTLHVAEISGTRSGDTLHVAETPYA